MGYGNWSQCSSLSSLFEATLFWLAYPGTPTTLCPATAHLLHPPTHVCLLTGSATRSGVRLRAAPGQGSWDGLQCSGLALRKPSPILPLGASSDKTMDYTIHWSRPPEPETLETAASENTVTSTDWRPGRDSGPQSHWSPLFTNPDSQEHCNDQDLVKKHQSITKVTRTWEIPS